MRRKALCNLLLFVNRKRHFLIRERKKEQRCFIEVRAKETTGSLRDAELRFLRTAKPQRGQKSPASRLCATYMCLDSLPKCLWLREGVYVYRPL